MEKCLRDAAAAPLEILDLCCEAIDLQREFADKGSVLAISDAATGAAVLSRSFAEEDDKRIDACRHAFRAFCKDVAKFIKKKEKGE